MDSAGYPLLCRWGGEIVTDRGGVCYEGGHIRALVINTQMNFNELLDKVYETTGLDRNLGVVNMSMRYPTYGAHVAVPLDDENSLKAVWACARQAPSLEVYIEQSQSHAPAQVGHPCVPHSSTKVSTQSSMTSKIGLSPRVISDQNVSDQFHPSNSPHEELQAPLQSPMQTSNEAFNQEQDEVIPPPVVQGKSGNHNSMDDYNDSNGEAETDKELEFFEHGNIDMESDSAGAEENVGQGNTVSFQNVIQPEDDFMHSSSSSHCHSQFNLDDEFFVGQKFKSKAELLHMVKLWCIKRNHTFKTVESRPTTVNLSCGRKPNEQAVENCSWRLRASKSKDGFFKIIRYNGAHASTCVSKESTKEKLDHRLIGQHYKNILLANPGINIQAFIELIKKDFQSRVSYKKAWRAKQSGLELIFGSWEKSYEVLPAFMQALQQSNPGTVVEWCHTPTDDPSVKMLKRVFWAFKPSIDGFKHCRPLMTVDSTYLYGKYKGSLLIANGMDGNNQIFPLAFALVETENQESWSWFMSSIRINVTSRINLCVISQQLPEIIKAMTDISVGWAPPHAIHRFCIPQLESNFEKEYKDLGLKSLFELCASQSQHRKFSAYFNRIRAITTEGCKYLCDIGLEKWSICHDGGFRYGRRTTHMTESFSGVLRGACSLPITAVVQMTFNRVNKLFVERRDLSGGRLEEGYAYSPYAAEMIERNKQKAHHHQVEGYGPESGIYHVLTGRGNRSEGKGGHRQTVNINQGTCTCNKLQVFKYPCSHLLAVCMSQNLAYDAFIDPCYLSTEFHSTYRSTFHDIHDSVHWESYQGPKVMCDPSTKRDKGRPKFKRTWNEMDEGCSERTECSKCHQKGHNKQTCGRSRMEESEVGERIGPNTSG